MLKKIWIMTISFLPFYLQAQVSLNMQLPTAGMVQKESLWNLVLINNQNDALECSLKMTLQEIVSGQVVLTANSGVFILGKGLKVITAKDVQPVQYNYTIQDFSRNYLPLGTYIACYQLLKNKTREVEILAEECVEIHIDPLSPPLLNTPPDQAEIRTPYPQFTWMPPAPFDMFTNLSYDLLVTEVQPGQNKTEALQYNVPVYSKTNLSQPFENYASSFTALTKNKTYAWQVLARNGNSYAAKTDIWTFTLISDSIQNIINTAPYIRMGMQNAEAAIVHQGVLKLEYQNKCADKTITVSILKTGVSKNEKQVISFPLPVTEGQNFLLYDFNQKVKLKEQEIYEAVIINCNGERFSIKFTPTYYN